MNDQNKMVTPVWKWLLPLLLVVVGTLAYLNSFSGVYLMDDYQIIVGNQDLRHVFPLVVKWRCLTDWTFKLTYAIGGLNAAYYHAGNLLIHILAGLALFGIVRRTLLLPAAGADSAAAAPWLAFVTAALWIVHPLQTAAVTYMCQRYESLMGLLFLFTLYCFIRGVAPGSHLQRCWLGLAFVVCSLGMLCKEVMVAAPVVLVLYDYFFIAGSMGNVFRLRWRVHLPMFCSLGILFIIILKTWHATASAGGQLFAPSSRWNYLLTQSEVIAHYLRLSYVPNALCFEYSWPPVDGVGSVMMPGLLISGLLGLAGWALWRRQAWGFPLIWFFLILAPTSSFMPISDRAFDHRMYLPLAGVLALSVVLVFNLLQSVRGRVVWVAGGVLSLVAVSLCFALTVDRNRTYQSAEGMWRDVVAKRPDNIKGLTSLVLELLNSGKHAEAELYSRQLIEKLDVAGRAGNSVHRISPDILGYFQSTAHDNLGFALLYEGRTGESLVHFQKACSFRPGDATLRHNLGVALFLAGKTNQAMLELNAALAGVGPGREKTQALVAQILAKQGDYAGAVGHYRRALALNPGYLSAKCELAWLLATCSDDAARSGKEALALGKEVAELTRYASYHALDVMAAAYAESGLFDEAKEMAERARASALQRLAMQGGAEAGLWPMMERADLTAVIADIEKRILLYAARKPYREE